MTDSEITYELMLQLLHNAREHSIDNIEDTNQFSRVNPVTKQDLLKLPKHAILKNKDLSGLNTSVCSICLDHYKHRQHYQLLECNHSFHKCCIYKWFTKYNRTCPICRISPFT